MIVGAVAGGFVTLLILAVAWIALNRDPTPLLTEADFQAASARWQQHGPASYDLDVMLGGNRPGPVHVEVRKGEITRMTRDGVEPKQQRTWRYWSVPGMLETIESELAMAAGGPTGFPGPPGAKAELRAKFDPQFGYPVRYHRTIPGANLEVDWTVTSFKAIQE